MLCWFSSLWWPFGWKWPYLGFLGIIWRTCGSKCQGGVGGRSIFSTLCVEFCLVGHESSLMLDWFAVIQYLSFRLLQYLHMLQKHICIIMCRIIYIYINILNPPCTFSTWWTLCIVLCVTYMIQGKCYTPLSCLQDALIGFTVYHMKHNCTYLHGQCSKFVIMVDRSSVKWAHMMS